MARFIRERQRVECEEFVLCFDHADGRGGYAFDCKPDGTPLPSKNEQAAANLARCLSGEANVIARGVHRRTWSYVEPAEVVCEVCNHHVQLDGDTATCDNCGTDYNLSGQRLAPRCFWGEETGETAADLFGPAVEW